MRTIAMWKLDRTIFSRRRLKNENELYDQSFILSSYLTSIFTWLHKLFLDCTMTAAADGILTTFKNHNYDLEALQLILCSSCFVDNKVL